MLGSLALSGQVMVDDKALTPFKESFEFVWENMLRAPQGGVLGSDAVVRINEDYVRTLGFFESVLKPSWFVCC